MPSLQILMGPNEGTIIPLEGERFVLGRNPDCAVIIPVISVSREHAQILRIGGKYFIEDKQSRNGTFVNNQAINTRTQLKNNDKIRICDFIAAFLDQPPAEAVFLDQQTVADAIHRAWQNVAIRSPERTSVEAECRVLYHRRCPEVSCLHPERTSLEAECRALRSALEANHVLCDHEERLGLREAIADPSSAARGILGAGFHRLVFLDAEAGRARGTGAFDLDVFLRHVYEQLVRAFDLNLPAPAYHLEIIAQLLKEEPRSLFCFSNVQLLDPRELRRLRGFTQELHQVLFLFRGRLPPAFDEPVDEADESDEFCIEGPSGGQRLSLLDEIGKDLRGTLELGSLLPKITDSLFAVFRQADRCFIIQTDAEGKRLLPRVGKTRRPTDEGTARFSKSIVRKCLGEGKAFLSDEAIRDHPKPGRLVGDFCIRSVMCAPLCRYNGKAFGAIQLDTQDRSMKFTQEDLKFLCGVAVHAAVALENAGLLDKAVKPERL
jgi:hypothetical protein